MKKLCFFLIMWSGLVVMVAGAVLFERTESDLLVIFLLPTILVFIVVYVFAMPMLAGWAE